MLLSLIYGACARLFGARMIAIDCVCHYFNFDCNLVGSYSVICVLPKLY